MSEGLLCDNHQFQINTKIITSAHDRCTMPSSAGVCWTCHHFTHRIDKENKTSLVHTVFLELKNPLCWYWFLMSCSCDMFSQSPCLHRPADLCFWQPGAFVLRGATELMMMWMDGICSVTTESQRDSGETRWPCGAQWCHPGTGWAAGWRSAHCTTAPICSGRSPSFPRGSRRTRNPNWQEERTILQLNLNWE